MPWWYSSVGVARGERYIIVSGYGRHTYKGRAGWLAWSTVTACFAIATVVDKAVGSYIQEKVVYARNMKYRCVKYISISTVVHRHCPRTRLFCMQHCWHCCLLGHL
jgi:hypothetical protein